jgi:hypothetical protein
MLNIVRAWILLSTLLVSSGWILSAVHQLNRPGYEIIFALALAAFLCWQRKTKWRPQKNPRQLFHKFQRRFKHPAPFFFLILVILSLAGGALYISTDGDSMAYRIPRVLHWLGAERWHWIHTFDPRRNFAAAGFEWLSAPLILFTRTDRLLFLINWVSYLMLPGLIFSVFTRLQVRPRVAWWWMWVLPSGWCFVLQSSSDMNDSFAAIYALAAVDLALRAREKNSLTDLWLSLLTAALLTDTKQTNLPLVLLWLVAAWPCLRLMLVRPAITAAVVVGGLLVSILPVAVFNIEHYGTWLPLDAPGLEAISGKSFELKSPFWGVVGNAFCIPAQNLMPPFFPWTSSWNATMDRFVQTPFGSHFLSFEHFGLLSLGTHGVTEANAGIGLGICILTLVSFCTTWRIRKMVKHLNEEPDCRLYSLRIAPWALLVLFMANVGTYDNARQLAAYYPFFFPLLLTGSGHVWLTRRMWWRWLCLLIMAGTAALLVVSRDRPLFPAQTILAWLKSNHPHSKIVSRAELSYQARYYVDDERNFFRTNLPLEEKTIGYAATIGNDEVGLWLPFGQRRVECVLPHDPPEKIRSLGVHWIVVDSHSLGWTNQNIEQWMDKYDGELAGCFVKKVKIEGPPDYIYLIHLRDR